MRKNHFFKKLPTPFSINIYVNMTCFFSIDVDFYTFIAKTLATDHSVFQLKHFFSTAMAILRKVLFLAMVAIYL